MNTKIIKLDLNRILYDKIIAKQGDTKSRFLLFQLLDGSIAFNLTNRSVRAYMVKPDGKEIFNDLIINNYSLGYCTLELTNQVLAVPGTVKIELMVTEEDRKLTSSVFELEVIKSINSEKSIVSTNEFTALLNGLSSLSEYDNYKNEIAAARDGEVNLLTKVKKIDEQLDKKESKEEVARKSYKEYVDTQDADLLRQIGQGVTDEQLKNAVQSKIDDGSIASLAVGEDSVRPLTLNNGAKSVEPLIWRISEDSILKNTETITISSNVGVVYRDKFIYVTPNSYTFDSTDSYLILRDVTLQTNPSETHTPLIVKRVNINENDIILAYYSAQITTIWDSIIAEYISNINKNILATPLPTSRRTPLGGFATITSRTPFNIDTINKTIIFSNETYINYNGNFLKLSSNIVDITNALKGGWLWYDTTNNKVVDTKPSSGENYIYLGTLWINPIVVNINNECGFTLDGMPYNYQDGRWNGKTINCIGDSITEGVGTSKPYHQWLHQLCGFKTVINNGIGATYFAEKNGDNWGKNAEAFCNRTNTIDITGDLILFAGLTNDFGIGNVIGTINDTTKATVYGAMKIAFDNVIRRNPSAKIVLALPIQRNDMTTNSLGLKLEDYINAGKEVAKMYSIPIINGYENSGITIKNIDSSTGKMRFTGDNLHPNDEGQKKLALLYSGVLNNI